MSRRKLTFVENSDFVRRFVKVCGTKEPAKVARLLNISYQSAKNYLAGRLPSPYVLRTIAEITPYSIHWLLTGEGEKFSNINAEENTPELTNEMKDFIRQVCMEAIEHIPVEDIIHSPETVVILSSDKIKQEKISKEFQDIAE